jgi:putative intracellular protease/amidase
MGHKTGLWLEEVAVPYYLFREKGFQVILASIKGGEIPIDIASLTGDAYVPAAKKFMEDEYAQSKLQKSIVLADVDFSTVDAIYLAGGHGTCDDFVANATLKHAVETVYAAGKIVAAVCHGPIGLAQCVKPDGTPLVAGKTVTGFTDAEEKAVGLTEKVPFLIETKFKEQGANFVDGYDWKPNICVDGNLFTGQNPASSEKLSQAVAKALA